MTVGELIDKLSKYPREMRVAHATNNAYTSIEIVRVDVRKKERYDCVDDCKIGDKILVLDDDVPVI